MKRRRANATLKRTDLIAEAKSARAERARGRGAVMIGLGVVLIPTLAAITFVLNFLQELHSGTSSNLRGPLMYAVGTPIAVFLVLRGRQLRAKGAEYVLAHDDRPPIVYLRSFQSDRMPLRPSVRSRRRWRVFRHSGFLGQGRKTYEARLGGLLDDVAPFVTIGNPTEKLPQLGAARLYADDDEWHQAVDDLLARGGTIILLAGDSPGLGWEVERIVALNEPQRLIISLPLNAGRKKPTREQGWEAFRTRFGDDFPRGLPEGAGETQFLYFDADWTPQRLEQRQAAAQASPESPGEQRATVLRKLAPEFKLMWAPLWARASLYCAVIALPIVLLTFSSRHSQPARMTASAFASRLKPAFQRWLQTTLGDSSITINALTCVPRSVTTARCVASASDSRGTTRQIPLAVTIDRHTRTVVWRVTQ